MLSSQRSENNAVCCCRTPARLPLLLELIFPDLFPCFLASC